MSASVENSFSQLSQITFCNVTLSAQPSVNREVYRLLQGETSNIDLTLKYINSCETGGLRSRHWKRS